MTFEKMTGLVDLEELEIESTEISETAGGVVEWSLMVCSGPLAPFYDPFYFGY